MITPTQQILLAILPKFSAGFSVIGSTLIILQMFLKVWRKRRTVQVSNTTFFDRWIGQESSLRVYHRLVLGMSFCDLLASLAWFFTTWPIPRGTPNVFAAVGTEATCTAQGFFAQFSIATVMYNASLALYYLLVITYGFSEEKVRCVEPYLHVFSVLFGLLTSSVGAFMGMFNHLAWDCWIRAHPQGCIESWKAKQLGVEPTCTKGDNATILLWAGFYGPLWLACLFVSIAMISIYRTVRLAENASNKFRFRPRNGSGKGSHTLTIPTAQSEAGDVQSSIIGPSEAVGERTVDETKIQGASTAKRISNLSASENLPDSNKRSRKVANQGMLYVGAFYFTWLFPTLFNLTLTVTHKVVVPLLLITATVVPTQGIFNFFVYIRQTYMRMRIASPDLSAGRIFCLIFQNKADVQLKEVKKERRRSAIQLSKEAA